MITNGIEPLSAASLAALSSHPMVRRIESPENYFGRPALLQHESGFGVVLVHPAAVVTHASEFARERSLAG